MGMGSPISSPTFSNNPNAACDFYAGMGGAFLVLSERQASGRAKTTPPVNRNLRLLEWDRRSAPPVSEISPLDWMRGYSKSTNRI